VFYILDNTRPLFHQYYLRYTPTQSVIISFLLLHTVVIYESLSPVLVNRVFISTQSLLKQANAQTTYFVVFIVVILVFCYVPLKFMYVQYWNTIPPFGRLHRKKTSKPLRKYNIGLRTVWTKILFIFGSSSEVKHSKFGTTKDTLRHSDLSNRFRSLSVEMPRIF